jgi:hypothetical protein
MVGSPLSGFYQPSEGSSVKIGEKIKIKNSLPPDADDLHKNVHTKIIPIICKNDFCTLFILVTNWKQLSKQELD